MLCSKCQNKLNTGTVSSDYINVAKRLLSAEGQNQFLQTVNLVNVIDASGVIVLVVGKGDSAKFNANQKFVREFGDSMDRKLLVIETGMNDRKFLEDLFAGSQIMTINILWLPDGSTATRVVLGERDAKKLSKKRIQALIDIAKKVRNMDLIVEYTE
jgi:transcription antitermination factor NusA-like protein